MTAFQLPGSRLRDDRDADGLATPDVNEAKNLGLHVRQCARRYGSLSGKIEHANARLDTLVWLVYLVIALLIGNGALGLKDIVSTLTG